MKKILLILVAVCALLCGCEDGDTGVVPIQVDGRLVGFYMVGNLDSDNINVYRVNTATGELTQVPGSPFAAGLGVGSLAVHPSLNWVYAGGFPENQIQAFDLNLSTGALTQLGGFPVATQGEHILVLDLNGRYLYAIGETSIDGFTVNPDGTLTGLAGFPIAVPGSVNLASGVFDRTNRFFYVSDDGSDQIFAFSVDGDTGGLTLVNTVANPGGGFLIAIEPGNRWLYSSNNDGTIGGFAINGQSGALSGLGGGFPVVAFNGTGGLGTGITFRNQSLFASDAVAGGFDAFVIDQTTGQLTAQGGYPVFTPLNSPRFLPNLPFLFGTAPAIDGVNGFLIDNQGAAVAVPGNPAPTGDNPRATGTAFFVAQ